MFSLHLSYMIANVAMGWMPDKSVNPSTIYSNHLMNPPANADINTHGIGETTRNEGISGYLFVCVVCMGLSVGMFLGSSLFNIKMKYQ